MDQPASEVVHLRADQVSLVLELPADLLPVVRHWGADLGELSRAELADVCRAALPALGNSPFDVADRVAVLPEHGLAWTGRPGVEGSRAGRDWSVALRRTGHEVRTGADGEQALTVTADDPGAALCAELHIGLTPQGLVRARATLGNTGDEPYAVGALRLTLPVPSEAEELLDFTGRHTMERVPQRRPFRDGVHLREVRSGRPGLDSVHLLLAGAPGFGFGHGQVWGRARGLEWQPAGVCRTAAQRRAAAGRRGAARARGDHPGAGGAV